MEGITHTQTDRVICIVPLSLPRVTNMALKGLVAPEEKRFETANGRPSLKDPEKSKR